MSHFTQRELAYLQGEPRLGWLATVGRDGVPHAAPVGFAYNAELDTIDIGGRDMANTKKFRDIARTGRTAFNDPHPPRPYYRLGSRRPPERPWRSMGVMIDACESNNHRGSAGAV